MQRNFLWTNTPRVPMADRVGMGSRGLSAMLERDGFFLQPGNRFRKEHELPQSISGQASHVRPQGQVGYFLFMYGGPSHIDTFDYKPSMTGQDGKTVQVKTHGRGGTAMKVGSSSRDGSSSSTVNAVNGSAISFRTLRNTSMTLPLFIP